MVILDADTTMAPDFVAVDGARLARGGVAWQGYYTVRDPGTSPSTALRCGALALRHYVRPVGRTALGGSCGLFGNGMVFRAELLRDRRFSAHLVEDVEFQLDLLLDGELVALRARCRRRRRDARQPRRVPHTERALGAGRLDVARRYVPELARRSLRGSPSLRAADVDALADQLTPPLSVVAAGSVAAVVASTALARRGGRLAWLQAVLTWASLAALGFHVIGGFRLARVPKARVRRHAPRPASDGLEGRPLAADARGRREVAWTRTARNAG